MNKILRIRHIKSDSFLIADTEEGSAIFFTDTDGKKYKFTITEVKSSEDNQSQDEPKEKVQVKFS